MRAISDGHHDCPYLTFDNRLLYCGRMTGHELREIRRTLGLTQAELAKRLGYSHQIHISRIEARQRKRIPAGAIARIKAEFLRVKDLVYIDSKLQGSTRNASRKRRRRAFALLSSAAQTHPHGSPASDMSGSDASQGECVPNSRCTHNSRRQG